MTVSGSLGSTDGKRECRAKASGSTPTYETAGAIRSARVSSLSWWRQAAGRLRPSSNPPTGPSGVWRAFGPRCPRLRRHTGSRRATGPCGVLPECGVRCRNLNRPSPQQHGTAEPSGGSPAYGQQELIKLNVSNPSPTGSRLVRTIPRLHRGDLVEPPTDHHDWGFYLNWEYRGGQFGRQSPRR